MITVSKNSLVLMVGPSGAGKTTIAHQLFDAEEVFSSDAIRQELFGDFRVQKDPGLVFSILRDRVFKRIQLGQRSVVDATNLKRRDRMSVVQMFDETFPVYYFVWDRPFEEKIKTGGWRLEVKDLIRRHSDIFLRNEAEILTGDGGRATVVDLRNTRDFLIEI